MTLTDPTRMIVLPDTLGSGANADGTSAARLI
jgi:hypothetical protein